MRLKSHTEVLRIPVLTPRSPEPIFISIGIFEVLTGCPELYAHRDRSASVASGRSIALQTIDRGLAVCIVIALFTDPPYLATFAWQDVRRSRDFIVALRGAQDIIMAIFDMEARKGMNPLWMSLMLGDWKLRRIDLDLRSPLLQLSTIGTSSRS